ncbi:hypothetical protein V4Y02_24090, partial [Escherichia coli]
TSKIRKTNKKMLFNYNPRSNYQFKENPFHVVISFVICVLLFLHPPTAQGGMVESNAVAKPEFKTLFSSFLAVLIDL